VNKLFRLPIEQTFNEFVERFGGELVERLLPQRAGEKRADYLFRAPEIIAELKCLEHDLFTPDYRAKFLALVNSWHARGLIRVYGTVRLDLRKLPKQCQMEWLRITEQPINRNIVSRANRQIRETKKSLGLRDAKGVLLIANEANRTLTPADIFTLLSRILGRKKPDGSLVCSSIHWIVLFSTNVAVLHARDPRPMTFWRAAYRTGPDPAISNFLADMQVAWNVHCAEKQGLPLKEVNLSGADFEEIRFV
jgi:hypothetical protein